MTRLELLPLLLSLKTLLESGNTEKALELINNFIAEAKKACSDASSLQDFFFILYQKPLE